MSERRAPMNWFHISDGWYVRRLVYKDENGNERDSGGVEIVRVKDLTQPPPSGGPYTDDVYAIRLVIPGASEWASVVAHVSKRGETGESWQRALLFHAGAD